ncbi:MAG: hypothetical protein ACKVN9_06150 [Methylophilaceae bacterium]
MPDRIVVYDREKLYSEVWTYPATTVAKQYGISKGALLKICSKLEIPIPYRGYWVMLSNGKHPPKISLGTCCSGKTRITTCHWVEEEGVTAEREKLWGKLISTEPLNQPVIISSKISSLHSLAAKTRSSLLNTKPDENGLIQSPSDTLILYVSHESIDRAILIIDSIIKTCEQRGYEVTIVKNDHTVIPRIHVLGHQIGFRLIERTNKIPHVITPLEEKLLKKKPWLRIRKWDHQANCSLALNVLDMNGLFNMHTIGDTKNRKLEAKLEDFFVAVNKVAVQRTAEANEENRKTLEHQQELQRLEQLRLAREKENEKVTKLFRDIRNWERAQRIRSFVAEVNKSEANEHIVSASPTEWIDWALKLADSLDPTKVLTFNSGSPLSSPLAMEGCGLSSTPSSSSTSHPMPSEATLSISKIRSLRE